MRKFRPAFLIFFSLILIAAFSFPLSAQEQPRSAVMQDCEDLDYSIKREGSPYHYKNPNEGCEISLSLDGLPTKTGGGYSNTGNDACRAIRGITSNLEGVLNDRLQGALSQIGDVVSADELDQLAGAAGINSGSITGVMRDGLEFGRTLNPAATETLGSLATERGRESLREEVTGDAVRDSLQNQQQGAGTPGINSQGNGAAKSDSSWSIFD
jgi:hypothetical protein